jgi:hypothetical protein
MKPSARRVASRWVHGGLLTPPPKMVEAVTGWALSNFAAYLADTGEVYVSDEVRSQARQDSAPRFERSGDFYLDLRGWPYLRHIQKVQDRAVAIVSQKLDRQEQRIEKGLRAYKVVSKMDDQIVAEGRRDPFGEAGRRAVDYIVGLHPDLDPFDVEGALDGDKPDDEMRVPPFLQALYGLTPVDKRTVAEIRRMLKEVKADSPEQMAESALRVLPKGFVSINVLLDFTPRSRTNGSYEWKSHTLLLFPLTPLQPTTRDPRRKGLDTVQDYSRVRESIANTVRHELVHMSQELIEVLAGIPQGTGGLPSRSIRDTRYDSQGIDIQRRERGQVSVPKDYLLRDVEFYAWLSDEVALFKRAAQREGLPLDLWDEARKVWVGAQRGPLRGHRMYKGKMKPAVFQMDRGGTMDFFKALKQEPAKWRKAVGEFWKATEPDG